MKLPIRIACIGAGVSLLVPSSAQAQWTNRYPKVQGYSHHVYLEGYELPLLTAGPVDPAPAPNGEGVAYADRGWLWLLDTGSGEARRLTSGPGVDARPSWSPDGSMLVFVRDDGSDTSIWTLELGGGTERKLVDTPAIDLDPVFSPDGGTVYYSSAEAGALDLWALDVGSGERRRVTTAQGLELKPSLSTTQMVYIAKRGADAIRVRDLGSGDERTLVTERITSMTRPVLDPAGKVVAYNWPTQDGYELRLVSVDDPSTSVRLTRSQGLPITPAWSADGRHVYFAEAEDDERMGLHRIAVDGGVPERIPVRARDWGVPTGTVRIRTIRSGGQTPVPARVSVEREDGHPLIAAGAQARFDGQHGRVFFYSPGLVDIEAPAGPVQVAAVQGLVTPEARVDVDVPAGGVVEVTVTLAPVWDAMRAGWVSGDHHFHLNYGGPYRLTPDDLPPMMHGEALNVATPLLANLHNRFEEQHWWGTSRTGDGLLVRFGQEVRSHFLGHLGLLDTDELFWPWVWGPGYQVYGADDRPNTDALEYARAQGGLGMYVHPFSGPDPFSDDGMRRVPVELVVDGVLGAIDLLEVACLWSDELGTSELWYRFLNVGVPIAPSAGTDVMNNFYRTMAVGTTRVYARTGGAVHWPAYLEALRAGRSFVTTGPMLTAQVGGVSPGDVVDGGTVAWTIDLHSAVPVERVELLVNGSIVWSDDGLNAPGSRTYEGTVDLPDGGWVAARAVGGTSQWPSMSTYPFAHTGAIWIGEVGSTDPAARRAAAADLGRVLEVAASRLRQAYGDVPTPRLDQRFNEARARLAELSR